MSQNYLEKRREPRRPASGQLTIRVLDSGPAHSFQGNLLDISDHGFRAAHAHPGLIPGQEVDFEHASSQGRARIVWNRIHAGSVETGFFILSA